MSNLPSNLQNLVANLVQTKEATNVATGDFQYLKMDKTGTWIYGADETEADPKGTFVIDPASYAQGFVAWDSDAGTLVDEKMAPTGQAPILQSDLPDVGVPWQTQLGFALLGYEGDDKNVQLMYKASSLGGKKEIQALIQKIIERGKQGLEELCPIVELDKDSYKHKKYGRIYTPVFEVVGWTTVDDVTAAEAEAPAEAPAEEAEAEAEAEVPKLKRRTRTRS